MARRRLTGFSRFVMAMLLIIPAAIIGSLWLNNEEISVDNITNPDKWTEKKDTKTDVEDKKDIKIIRNDTDVKEDDRKPQNIKDLVNDIKNKNKDKEAETIPDEDDNQPDKKRNLKDLLNKVKDKNKGETEKEVTIDDNIPVSADVKALQARISRLEDDIAEKDARIEKLYQEKQSTQTGNDCKATRDSLRMIQGKLEDLKRALN